MKKFYLQSWALILLSFVLGFSEFIIIGILDDLAHQFNVTVATAGSLVTIFALVYAFSTPVITSLLKNNLYHALLVLIGIFILGNLVTVIAPNYSWLVISRIIVALVSGSLVSLAMTFAAKIAPMEKKAWLVSWIFSGFSIASVFGVPLGTWISTTWGWRITFVTIVLFSIIALILIMKVLPHQLNQTQADSVWKQFIIFKDPRIFLSVGIIMFSLAGVYVFYTYLRPILSQTLGFNHQTITFLLVAYGLMSLLSNQFSGKIANKHGLKIMPWYYAIEFFVLLFMPKLLTNQLLGVIDILCVGFLMYLINSPIQLHIMGIAEKEYPQSLVLSSSINSIFSNLGISLGSAVGGIVTLQFKVQDIGAGGVVFTVVTFVLVLALNHVNRKQSSKVQ
ncbi:MFS transporter (plasmid) [Bombilactobacillus folatiphilus]|uniref:MFS transporter n=1 Tax=Bombilactobacillus folatiphilus TaxID=2923362 RepID=A0ABY4PBA6_9LACO|nr:MFS transporter [Bombilactobacillus folatiphilus]UQS81428.1 MFS transporter [Bombilactobacillus folatiphilus]UQS82839.1 MFS transporter [Bombilactobacillus folatiphilus]UQS82945.1 MFS transporter [Bombilactobacillus folatiphilus]